MFCHLNGNIILTPLPSGNNNFVFGKLSQLLSAYLLISLFNAGNCVFLGVFIIVNIIIHKIFEVVFF